MQEELQDYEETTTAKATMKTTTTSFNDFLLNEELNKVLKDIQFEHPSEVQQLTIPKAILGVDIFCQAKSGMGKTAVFVISTLQQLIPIENEIQIMVLVNTKEMAEQIFFEFSRFLKYFKNIKIAKFIGGESFDENISKLKEFPNIFIGTPGRTLHLVLKKEVLLRHVKFFILDEADQLLQDLNCRWTIQQIFMATNPKKQTMLFSATFNEYTKTEALKFLKNPHQIILGDTNLILHGLVQFYIKTNNKEKSLISVLDRFKFNQAIVFCREKFCAERLNKLLLESAFPTITIHSNLNLEERTKRTEDFKKLKYRILLTTNLFSRGIDIQDINLVINFDMPESTETYLHRVGRAGRFDTKGSAVSFVYDEKDVVMLNEVQRRFEVEIKEME